jgi:lipoate-protein ligase A
MINVLKYELPDSFLIDTNATCNDWFLWVPEQLYLVLGQSNKVENSIFEEKVLADKIPVIKRPSGGETVILSPKTLIISVRMLAEKLENPQISFKKINNSIISTLESMGVEDLQYRGISDICIGEKKILGSSIYRKKNLVFYHAVLNISENIELISKYLRHPPREPEYRKGRSHDEFVTNLYQAGYPIAYEEIIIWLENGFRKDL